MSLIGNRGKRPKANNRASDALVKRPSILIAAALATTLSGCALLGSKPAPRDTYELTAPSSVSGVGIARRAQVLVKAPGALKALDSDRMLLRPSPSELTILSGAQWSDSVPAMVQAKLVEAFENSGAFGATAKPGDGLVIDYQVISDIRRFEVDTSGAPTARFELSVKLLSDKSGRVVESRVFNGTAPVSGADPADYVRGYNAAFDEVASSLVRWVAGRI